MLRYMLSAAKDLLAGALEASGHLWRRVDRTLHGKVLVLMYHRVLPEVDRDSFSDPGIIVTPETFDRHLLWIQTHLNPLTATEFSSVLNGTRPPPLRACLVTFDDGWRDNFTHALPALNRHGVPALLFAATGFIGTAQCFWQERLSRLLYAAWQAGPRGSGLLDYAKVGQTLNLPDAAVRRSIRNAVTRIKSLSPPETKAMIQQIEDGLVDRDIVQPEHFGDDHFLSWAELQQVSASDRVTIGSHAVSHFPLPRLPLDTRARELTQSRAILEARIGRQIDWFAYPNGDYDTDTIALVRAAGYRGAFTTESGQVAPGQDVFTLRRVNMHEGATHTLGRFLSKITGLL